MADAIERAFEAALASGTCNIGEVTVQRREPGFWLTHRDESERGDLAVFQSASAAGEIARCDDAGKFRPLKTAPNLRHGWRLELKTLSEAREALDQFYPGRLALWWAWQEGRLKSTPLRDSLGRQTGMYRVAATISDEEADEVVAAVCRSDTGCLRTVLWKRDQDGNLASSRLPPEKFDPRHDQYARASKAGSIISLLCPEACAILIGACRARVKGETSATTTDS